MLKLRIISPEYYDRIEKFIDEYKEESGCSPTTLDIANGTGFTHSATNRYLMTMRENSMIEYKYHNPKR